MGRRVRWIVRIARTLAIVAAVVVLVLLYLTQPIGRVLVRRAETRVDPECLRQHVETLAQSHARRTAANLANLDRAADYILGCFAASGLEPVFQSFHVKGESFRNVIASVGPDTAERVIVGAHYDAAGPGVGADDNASGVAGLLALAPLLVASGVPLRVELVAYSLEEPPFF